MRETAVEKHLKKRLGMYGFIVIKLETPGYSHVMDRMILRPKFSPGPPWFVECKRPDGPGERRAQELRREEWVARGLLVLDVCDNYARVHEIEAYLVAEVAADKRAYEAISQC